MLAAFGRRCRRLIGAVPPPPPLSSLQRRCAESFNLYAPGPFHPVPRKPSRMTAEEAVGVVRSGHTVFVHGGSSTPLALLRALCDRAQRAHLRDIELVHVMLAGDAPWTQPEYEGIIRSNNLFIGPNCRRAVSEGRGDFTPIFLSDIPILFRKNIIQLDAAFIQLTPPDAHGFSSLGGSVDCACAAIQNASYVVGLINPNQPRTFGDGIIHQSHIDAMVYTDDPLPEVVYKPPDETERKIAELIASSLVEDGATLQTGMGRIPNHIMSCLGSHKDLGIHSEVFTDGVIDLFQKGVISNSKKVIQQGKIAAGFCFGTRRLYDFVNDNPSVVMLDIAYLNNAAIIARNPKVTAINTCIEIDLTGQVVADSIGSSIYSGVGGQLDFIRGAALSTDGLGKPIIAMTSTTRRGESKIVDVIKPGAGVVTTRAHVHYVVTEYGVVNLFGRTLRQRAYDLISIAHPDHRQSLEKAAFSRLKCMPAP